MRLLDNVKLQKKSLQTSKSNASKSNVRTIHTKITLPPKQQILLPEVMTPHKRCPVFL